MINHFRGILLIWVVHLTLSCDVVAQVLHTENFNVIVDTSKHIKGNFTPNLRYRNVKRNFLEIENTADISVRLANHAITIANKIEYSIFGDQNLLSGGFVYVEYINLKNERFAYEPFYQMHWSEIRGLDRKYAGGINLRWRPYVTVSTSIFAGLGGLFEYERWNYLGVRESQLPANTTPIEVQRLRGNVYLSFKQRFGSLFDLDVSGYVQPLLTNPLQYFRLASSVELTYNLTKYLGIRCLYQNIYDSRPLVPIDPLYHDFSLGITLSF